MSLKKGDILHKLIPAGDDELFEIIDDPAYYVEGERPLDWITVRLHRIDASS